MFSCFFSVITHQTVINNNINDNEGAPVRLTINQGAPEPLTNNQEALGSLTDNQGALEPLTDDQGSPARGPLIQILTIYKENL